MRAKKNPLAPFTVSPILPAGFNKVVSHLKKKDNPEKKCPQSSNEDEVTGLGTFFFRGCLKLFSTGPKWNTGPPEAKGIAGKKC